MLTWHKSSYSGYNGDCVRVAATESAILVRDSKDPDGPVLSFTPDEWRAFLRKARAGT
jgi:hypothetical protein